MRLTRREAKYLRSLQQKKVRQRERKFVLEGWRAVAEALHAAAAVEYVAVAGGDHAEGHAEVLAGFRGRGVPVREADAALLDFAAATVQAQGVLALVAQRRWSVEEVLRPGASLVVALDGVADPGNLGTVLRTCDWFGAASVLLGRGSVELHNEKVVRSTVGSLLRLPAAEDVDLPAALAEARRLGLIVVAASGDGTLDYLSASFGSKTLFVFGSEAHGVSGTVRAVADVVVRIPCYGRAESLNVGVACGILLAHWRTRRAGG
jgi:TrmH family RNA methyltransferase